MKKGVTKRSEDYNQWYQDVIEQADLAENSMVRGCMVIKPHGFAIWEKIKESLDARIKDTGHKNVYFPLFVPKSTLAKEADHVDGFAKETAIVTHHRLKMTDEGLEVDPESKLEEEVLVRPTSEAVMYETFVNWIESWRDLPLLVNQWANVVRWEMRTKLFLRTTEFLWQEGHTVHITHDEAEEETLKMLNEYKELCIELLAIDPYVGLKPESEKFPGALRTYTLEAVMQDGKALQSATSHNLGDNFSKAFNIQFSNTEGELEYPWQTSWGMSTRIIGALIMTHSDDNGLVLPPKVAPIQVAIVPIWKDENRNEILEYANKLKMSLEEKGIKVELDERDHQNPGYKFNEWEKKGVPLRVEIGGNELSDNKLTVVNRVTGDKESVSANDTKYFANKLDEIQKQLFDKAKKLKKDKTVMVDAYDEFKDVIESKKAFAHAFWCENEECEEKIKDETKATIRCLPLGSKEEKGKCIYCGGESKNRWLFAKAY